MLNKVTLLGHVAVEPEVRSFPNGKRVTNFVLCTAERWKDRVTGADKQKMEWHRIAVFNDKLMEALANQVKKGVLLMVEGQLETRKYTDSKEQERITTDVVLRPFKGTIQVITDTGPPTIRPPEVFVETPLPI